MASWLITGICVVVAGAFIWPSTDRFFDSNMPRHMLMQMPSLIILGIVAGYRRAPKGGLINPLGITGLIFFVLTFLFWMLPRSLDHTVTSDLVDNIMHINLFLAGVSLGQSLPVMSFMIKMIFPIVFLSMLIVFGLVYTNYSSLICATYTLEQQQETGRWLLRICAVLFGGWILYSIYTVKSLDKKTN